ncbi:thioredoxin [Actinoplanes sp. NPDC049596]|uniref:thioredoxin n=1 Tax=unclassified Actinoplanes TaxID=2626549 RepID=UPI0034241762
MGAGKAISDATFVSDVLQSDTPVLVDFWAEWCAPCKKVDPLLNEIATEMGDKVRIVSINIDENPETTRAYRVMSVPTLTIFKGGEAVNSVTGAKPKSALVNFIESAL